MKRLVNTPQGDKIVYYIGPLEDDMYDLYIRRTFIGSVHKNDGNYWETNYGAKFVNWVDAVRSVVIWDQAKNEPD